ncbi:MAG: hypothetical protein N0C88_01985 [Candidatus Thiodiazotropha lotti]|uniref:Uncharacterized protein n=1 Tax=Candidatus Thiodiazotropha lotti TaxID=2792787 RepID=A0A9E4K286_9GAMM|nr:hypothetical protein [Candidatus Thiodiazotropha lotti]MCW4202079.1 hypothetical protein [Candidatus Thiodiazotropha lotti]
MLIKLSTTNRMKKYPLLVVLLFLLVGCSEDQKYRVSQDPLDRKLFETALKENRIEYEVDKNGWYSTSKDKYDLMLDIGEKVSVSSRQKTGLPLNTKCHEEELIKYLNNNSIIFNIEKTGKGRKIMMRKQDFDNNNIIGRSVCIDNICMTGSTINTIQRCLG